jgi:hypothetical protein
MHLIVSVLDSSLSLPLVIFIAAMNLMPILGALSLEALSWHRRLVLHYPFGLALAFGGYSHFIGSGPDNVFR